jgi:hypothetical protein
MRSLLLSMRSGSGYGVKPGLEWAGTWWPSRPLGTEGLRTDLHRQRRDPARALARPGFGDEHVQSPSARDAHLVFRAPPLRRAALDVAELGLSFGEQSGVIGELLVVAWVA